MLSSLAKSQPTILAVLSQFGPAILTPPLNRSGYQGIALQVRGDGQRYKFFYVIKRGGMP